MSSVRVWVVISQYSSKAYWVYNMEFHKNKEN